MLFGSVIETSEGASGIQEQRDYTTKTSSPGRLDGLIIPMTQSSGPSDLLLSPLMTGSPCNSNLVVEIRIQLHNAINNFSESFKSFIVLNSI